MSIVNISCFGCMLLDALSAHSGSYGIDDENIAFSHIAFSQLFFAQYLCDCSDNDDDDDDCSHQHSRLTYVPAFSGVMGQG